VGFGFYGRGATHRGVGRGEARDVAAEFVSVCGCLEFGQVTASAHGQVQNSAFLKQKKSSKFGRLVGAIG
jgi:hypothetical protein